MLLWGGNVALGRKITLGKNYSNINI